MALQLAFSLVNHLFHLTHASTVRFEKDSLTLGLVILSLTIMPKSGSKQAQKHSLKYFHLKTINP